ncbi:PIN domain-like protein [Armillaria novae-zelandiae]|uniref:PIN domain-like protein n=1 Tax=Armillaria novae-zelandiae TaxID=153914 RepID=A0AA39P838_9AGAR|nr:PIN domain-like protein [Armillaria novae-zelandiae]
MGIPDLWQIVSGAAQNCSLIELALVAGIQHKDGHMLKIGVDASIWMVQCEAMFWGPWHAQAGDSPELRTLLFCLAYLLRCTVIPVFVFDGALHPGIKRGKKVRTRAPWLEKHFKEMIRAFGFYYHDAPGEAEAELAAMNKAGIIDMIITEDSNALVFGGMCILQRPPRSKGDNGKKIKIDPDEYVLYSSKHILAQDNVCLTEGGLFLLAILLGGDYDGNKGLSGCGQKTAHMLALTSLGDSLYLAVKTMDNSELQKYLTVWRDMLHSELLQPSIPGASKHPSLANKIPVAFPNMKILKYYAQPITSWHAGFEQRVVASAWEVPLPDIALISDFCSRFFHWDSDILLQHLRKNIWPGIIVQSLYRDDYISTHQALGGFALSASSVSPTKEDPEDNKHSVLGIDEGGCSVQDDNEGIIVLADSDSDNKVEIVGFSLFIDLADSNSNSEVEVIG